MPAGQLDAPLTDNGLQTVRRFLDKATRIGPLQSVEESRLAHIRISVKQVFPDAGVEKKRVLENRCGRFGSGSGSGA